MALVQKRNSVRNLVTVIVFAVVVAGGALFLFRGTLFPAATVQDVNTSVVPVHDLPVFSDSGAEVLNTNTAKALTPYGKTSVTPCPGRDNPFAPSTKPCP